MGKGGGRGRMASEGLRMEKEVIKTKERRKEDRAASTRKQ